MIRFLVSILVFVIDVLYKNRPYPRFYVLETVARVPYFSYLSVLHLYETLGLWRKSDWLKVHFAETWNELHHLLIMESLGGNNRWYDRLLAKSSALVYYWVIVVLYMISPRSAYEFMRQVEEHAFHTYDEFLKSDGERLKLQPAPAVAVSYYLTGDLYMFDEFQTSRRPEERRPACDTLYDVFVNIRDDEAEHVKTMAACKAENAQLTFKSPHSALPEAKSEPPIVAPQPRATGRGALE
ncbi:alternative oxidase [Gloeobacter morelensis]|uniref:Plastoquinol terminal oxidase n=1 Tax=Gloeobacter morelensis MG652769 TaxID=2781736 RepID=A0ABY3PLK9_9CYAN|nr:alternative oxidase [Gloeobacter morelensis]UFP94592.1 plastoquinol terminal oxidase [Gloeobacter morelensis MG652769]